MKHALKCFECYYCHNFFIREERQKRHMKNCTGPPGVVYNFNNQNLISYQDNFHAKGDIPFAIYFDFETTAPTANSLDPEQKKNCCFMCYDCYLSSRITNKLNRNPKKFCTFNRTANKLKLFYPRRN